jgi:Tol biopolymer transport system component/DNA-binding winged helix-turn-helix (wHTH) protein
MSLAKLRPSRRLYEFGPFRLDVEEHLLLRHGQAVPLPPKVFETLVVFVENSGRLLEKDELIRLLWPDSFVEDGSLVRKISYLRKALKENETEQRYIETVPRVGYRFIAEVRSVPEAQPVNGLTTTARIEPPAFHDHGQGASAPWSENSITNAAAVHPAQSGPEIHIPNLRRRWRMRTAVLAISGVAALTLLAYLIYVQRRAPAMPLEQRQTIRLTNSGQIRRQALSPDGKYLAYVLQEERQQSLWVQQTATASNVQIVPPAAVIYRSLSFSPDGNHVYYSYFGDIVPLFRVPTLGGLATKVMDDVDSPVAFSPNGQRMAFVRGYPARNEIAIVLTNIDGTGERILAVRKRPSRFAFDGLSWSPDGEHLAVGVENFDQQTRHMRVVAVRVNDGQEIPIGAQQWFRVEQVVWTGDGRGVIAMAWDPSARVFGGQLWYLPWPKGEVRRITNDLGDYESISLAASDALLTTIQESRTSYFWVERAGAPGQAIQASSAIGESLSLELGIAWLPDGRIVYGKNAGGNIDLWTMDAEGGKQRRLTTSPTADVLPAVSADGRTIVYVSYRDNRPHIWQMDIDGKNQRPLTDGIGETLPSLSPDGRWLLYISPSQLPGKMWKMPLAGGASEPINGYETYRALISPDGKWVAGSMYPSLDRSRLQLTVLPFEGKEPPRTFGIFTYLEQAWVQWSPDSRAIRYIDIQHNVSNLRSQPIDGGPSVPLTDFHTDIIFRFAFSPDGQSLICERGKKVRDVVLFKATPAN